MPFAQHPVPSAPGAGKSLGTEELNISELLLESSVPEWGVGLLQARIGLELVLEQEHRAHVLHAPPGQEPRLRHCKSKREHRDQAALATGTLTLPPFIPGGRRNTGKAGTFLALPLLISCM